MDALTELRFWNQIVKDAERTVICPPELEERCRAEVEKRGLSWVTVKSSPACPPDSLLIVDEQAIQAEMRKPIKLPPIYPGWAPRRMPDSDTR